MRFNESFIPELGKSPAVTAEVKSITDKVAARARASAEVDSGDYRDGIKSEIDQTAYRVFGRVVGTDEKTMIIESRTGNLSRALGSVTRG